MTATDNAGHGFVGQTLGKGRYEILVLWGQGSQPVERFRDSKTIVATYGGLPAGESTLRVDLVPARRIHFPALVKAFDPGQVLLQALQLGIVGS